MIKPDEKKIKKYEKKNILIFVIVCLFFWLVSIFACMISYSNPEQTETSEIYHSQEVKRVQTKPFPTSQLQSISTLEEGDIFLSNFGYAFNVIYQNGNNLTEFLDLLYGEIHSYIFTNTNEDSLPSIIPFYHCLPYVYGYGNFVYNVDYQVPGVNNIGNYPGNTVGIGLVGCTIGDTYRGLSYSNQFYFSYSSVSDNPDYDFMYRMINVYSVYSFAFDEILVFKSSNPIFTDEFWDILLSDYGIGCYKLIAPEDPDALENAYQTGFDNGKLVGDQEGYERGFDEGYVQGDEEQFTTNSFKTLFNVILNAPYNIYKGMLNFEVFGVNLFGFLSFILTTFLIFGIISLVRKK